MEIKLTIDEDFLEAVCEMINRDPFGDAVSPEATIIDCVVDQVQMTPEYEAFCKAE